MRSIFAGLFVVLLVLGTATSASAASVSYLEQTRSVEAQAGVSRDDAEDAESEAATDFDLFDATVTASYEDPHDGDKGHARTSQLSSLGDDGISTQGSLDASSFGEFSLSRSIVDVVFDLTAPAHYSLFLNLEDTSGDDVNPDRGFEDSTRTPTLEFFKIVGESQILLEDVTRSDILGGPYTLEHEFTGELAPGRYRFLFFGEVNTLEGFGGAGEAEFDYSTGLDLQVIPLPPALWAGLGMLGFMGGVRGMRQIRVRRA